MRGAKRWHSPGAGRTQPAPAADFDGAALTRLARDLGGSPAPEGRFDGRVWPRLGRLSFGTWLTKRRPSVLAGSAVAVDVAAAPVASARRHVAQAAKRDVFGAAGKVDVRQGDGIKPLRRGDAVDTLALLGVGTDTMLQVLRQGDGGGDCEAAAVQRQLRWLVVQPPAYNAPELRSRLAAIGWGVKSEAILVENGWLQCVLHAERTAMGDAEGAGEPKLRHASDERLLGPAALRADPETAPLVRLFGRKYEEALRGQREGIVRGLQGARAGGRVDELRERLEGVERDLEVLGSELALL